MGTDVNQTDFSAVYLAQSRVPEIIAGSIIPFVLASIIVFFRLYSRGIILRAWGWNDTLILICWLGGLTLIVIQCILTTCGVGRHIVLRPTSKIRLLRELALAAQIIYSLVLGIAKLSICICVLQEFRDVSIRMKYIIYLMFIFVTTYTTVLFFFLIFRCGSISTALSLGFSASKCWMQRDYIMILFAAFNITADFGLLVLVLLQILPLNQRRNQKKALLAIISLGLIAIGATLGRFIESIHLSVSSNDITWDGYRIPIWSSVDVSTSLFCTSGFAVTPLIRLLFPRFLSSYSTSLHNRALPVLSSQRKISSAGTSTSPLADGWRHSFGSYRWKRTKSTSTRSSHIFDRSWESRDDVRPKLGDPQIVIPDFGAPANPTQSRIWSEKSERIESNRGCRFKKYQWPQIRSSDSERALGTVSEEEFERGVSSITRRVSLEISENKERMLSFSGNLPQ